MATMQTMDITDIPASNKAQVFATLSGNKRYNMMCAKNVKVSANITTKEVKVLGQIMGGAVPTGMVVKLTMEIYKVTDMFDKMIENYKNSGILPTFDVQVTNGDASTSIGADTKIYKKCIITGDVLLSMADADGGDFTQSIEAYVSDYDTETSFTTPSYMGTSNN